MVGRMQVSSQQINLHQDNLLQWFSPANLSNSWKTFDTNMYVCENRNSNRLLVTIGDSWTYGSNLKHKDTQVYGYILSEQLESDWLNLSIPATGNFFQATVAEELGAIIPRLNYKCIDVVCTFTGVGRWFNTEHDVHIKYREWFDEHITKPQDFDQLLYMLNEQCVTRIQKALNQPLVNLYFATNFVDALAFESLPTKQILQLPWYKVMGLEDNLSVYTCLYYDRLSTATEFLDKNKQDWFKEWFLQIADITYKRYDLLSDAAKFENLHPLANGHLQWADYVKAQIN
jgi:hypothetical protein